MNRLLYNLILLGGVLFLPWWMFGLLALGGIVLFRLNIEIVLWCGLVDTLFATPTVGFFGWPYSLTSIALILLWLVKFYEEKVRPTD